MRYLVTKPLPDELLGSVWIRTVRRVGLPVAVVTKALTGRRWRPGLFQCSQVRDLANALWMEPMDLLWRHTTLPYVTAFYEASVFEGALTAALANGSEAVGMGAVTQSVSDHVPYRRFCNTCAREDDKRWKISYWHRAHNLPGVLLCPVHGAPLRQTDIPTAGPSSWDERLPLDCAKARPVLRVVRSFESELARRSAALLDRPYGKQLLREPAWYRAQLKEKGLLSPSRDIRAERLVQWLHDTIDLGRWRLRRLELLGLSGQHLELQWLPLMVRPRSGHPFIPLKHLLFETALALQGPVSTPILDYISTGPGKKVRSEQDRQFAAVVRAVFQALVQRGERVTVQGTLRHAGVWSLYRHGRELYPLTRAAVEQIHDHVRRH